jgi:hypothetical protein
VERRIGQAVDDRLDRCGESVLGGEVHGDILALVGARGSSTELREVH